MHVRGVLVVMLVSGCARPSPTVDSSSDTDVPTETGSPYVPPPGPRWVQVTTHPCARSDEGLVRCWASPTAVALGLSYDIPSPDFEASFLATSFSPLAIRAPDARAKSWWCASIDGDPTPLPFPTPIPPICDPPQDFAFQVVGLVFGLTTAGEIITWNQGPAMEEEGCPTDKVWRLFDAPASYAALATDNTTCVPTGIGPSGELVHEINAFPATMVVERIAVAGLGICALANDGTITCLGAEQPGTYPDPVSFPNPPYVDLAGGMYGVCAVRADWTIECNDGSEHHFGPIRSLAVTNHPIYDLVTGEGIENSGPRVGLNLCVITEDNHIRCDGPIYPPDLAPLLP